VYQTLGLTASPALSAETKAATTALNVVLPGVGTAVGAVVGMLTAHHAAAMQTEATTMNTAVPSFGQNIALIFQQLNAGSMTPTQAISALQALQTQYYASVAGIIKKSGPCASSCMVNGVPGGVYPQAPQSIGSGLSTSPNCCHSGGTCNAACCIGCTVIEGSISALIAMIRAGGGTYTVNPMAANPDNPSIQASPAVTVTYNGSQGTGGVSSLAQSVVGGTSTIYGFPTIYWLVGGGLLLFLLLRR
jgi:hypothetical protein